MPSLGRVLKERNPDLFKDNSEEDINASAVRNLSDPARRGVTLERLRGQVPEWKDVPDDRLAESIIRNSTGTIRNAPAEATDEQLQARRNASEVQGYTREWKAALTKAGQNEAADRRGLQAPSDVRQAKIDELRLEAPHPRDVMPARSKNAEGVPENMQVPERLDEEDDFRTFMARAKKENLDVTNPGLGFGTQTIAVDPRNGNKAKFALEQNASLDLGKVKGGGGMLYATGQADPFQQGITKFAQKAIFDPVTGTHPGNVWNGFERVPVQQDPLTGKPRQSSLGAPAGDRWGGLQDGYGFREYLGDVGEVTAPQDKAGVDLRNTNDKMMSYPVEGALRGMGYIDRAEEWMLRHPKTMGVVAPALTSMLGGDEKETASRSPVTTNANDSKAVPPPFVWERWADSNAKEAQVYENRANDVSDWRGFIDQATPEQRRESAALGSRYTGQAVGELASMATPTGATHALGAGAKGLWRGAPDVLKNAVGRGATAVGKFASDIPGSGLFSNTSKAWGVGSAEGRTTLDATATARRTSLDMAEEQLNNTLVEHLDRVGDAHGYGPKGKESLAREVMDVWGDPAKRANASPAAKELLDAYQPLHEAVFYAAGLDKAGKAYNPYHLFWGQDVSNAARMTETSAARAETEAGRAAWEAEPINPMDVADQPGIRKLSRQPGAPTKLPGEQMDLLPPQLGAPTPGALPTDTWYKTRPVDEVARDTIARLKAGGQHTDQELANAAKDFQQLNFVTGFSKTAKEALRKGGYDHTIAANELAGSLPALMKEDPQRYMPLSTLERQFLGGSGDEIKQAYHVGVDQYGHPRIGKPTQAPAGHNIIITPSDMVMPTSMEQHMIKNDLVLIEAAGEAPLPRGASKNLTVVLPEQYSALHGHVVDRHFAEAIGQIATNHDVARGLKDLGKTTPYGAAKSWADAWNHGLGLAQVNRSITGGNPGFEFRVLTGDMGRHAISEGMAGMTPKLRELVADISHTPLGSNHPDAQRVVNLGGNNYTLGELAEYLRKYGDVKTDSASLLSRRMPTDPGLGSIAQKAMEAPGKAATAVGLTRTGEMLGAGASGTTKAINAASTVAALPGKASSEAADASFRRVFSLNGKELDESWKAGQGIRALNMLSMMERGVDPRVAGRRMRMLMVDYADTNTLQELARPFVPFIKFYSSSIQGAAEIAARNPRRFSRLADAMRMIENNDQALHGGAFDPRGKSADDQIAMRPNFESAGRMTNFRVENPWGDVVDIGTAAKNSWDKWGGGQEDPNERGMAQFLGPAATIPYAIGKGRDLVSGRPILPVDENQMGSLPSSWLPSQYMAARDQGMLKEPGKTGAYLGLKYNPLTAGRLMTSPMDLFLRVGAGMGGGTSAKLAEDDIGAMQRATMSYTTGAREQRVDTVQNARNKVRPFIKGSEKIPEVQVKDTQRQKKQGRIR